MSNQALENAIEKLVKKLEDLANESSRLNKSILFFTKVIMWLTAAMTFATFVILFKSF